MMGSRISSERPAEASKAEGQVQLALRVRGQGGLWLWERPLAT